MGFLEVLSTGFLEVVLILTDVRWRVSVDVKDRWLVTKDLLAIHVAQVRRLVRIRSYDLG